MDSSEIKKCTVSGKAQAKLILIGEHFVVHGGVEAIAVPVSSLWTKVDVTLVVPVRSDKGEEGVVRSELNGSYEPPILKEATDQVSSLYLESQDRVEVARSMANFPMSRGFGSSASFGMALCRALSQVHGHQNRVLQGVHVLEKYFHGNPSGIDAAAVASDAPIVFSHGNVLRNQSIGFVDLVLFDSGPRTGCAEQVRRISALRKADPNLWTEWTRQVESISFGLQKALGLENSQKEVGLHLSQNHKILSEMGLSTPSIENLLEWAESRGALGGKVSGAGAGGAVVIAVEAGTSSLFVREFEKSYRGDANYVAVVAAQDACRYRIGSQGVAYGI